MAETDQDRIARLEKRIEQLEALLTKDVARVESECKALSADLGFHIDRSFEDDEQFRARYFETDRLARAAFYKTHPEVLRDIIKAEKITGEWKDGRNDPQP
jgi:hypothetical protein